MNVRSVLAMVFAIAVGLSGTILPIKAQTSSNQIVPELSDEAYAVYSAVIETFIPEKTPLQRIVLKQRTVIEWSRKERVQYLRQQIPELDQTTTQRFKQRNKTPDTLDSRFETRIPVTLVTQQEIDDIFREGVNGWKVFYERYPNSQGLMEFSRVGFNVGHTQALVYVGNLVGPLAGEGTYMMLVKENGVWKPRKQVNAWIS